MKQLKTLLLAAFPLLFIGMGANFLIIPHAQAAVHWVDRVAAVVDDDVVMESELNKRINVITSRLNAQGTPLPPMSVLRKRVLNRLILESIQLQMAKRIGIQVDDSELNDTLMRIAKSNHFTLAQFRDALESEGTSFRDAREQIRHEMIIGRLQQSRVGRLIRITDKEVKDYLASAEGRKHTATEYYLGHILVSVPDSATPEQDAAAKKKAESILADLKKGVDFKQEAVAKSDGQNALKGGVLGWRKEQELPSIAANLIPNLKVGEFTGLLKTASGYHILAVLDKRGGQQKIVTQTHVRHILIKPSAIRTEDQAHVLAESIYQRLQKGEDFATLAKAHSEDPVSAVSGGDLDWVSPGEMVPEFEEMMNKTPEGQISKPFRTKYGWHILQVLGHRKKDVGQEIQENQARQAINKRKFNEELVGWLQKIRQEAYVDIKPEDWNAPSTDSAVSSDGSTSEAGNASSDQNASNDKKVKAEAPAAPIINSIPEPGGK
jgi:peptidyl-prolyl cis-trans isomerase SurA